VPVEKRGEEERNTGKGTYMNRVAQTIFRRKRKHKRQQRALGSIDRRPGDNREKKDEVVACAKDKRRP